MKKPVLSRVLMLLSTVVAWVPLIVTGQVSNLWQIGTANNSAAEFALAPNRYNEFVQGGRFVVGQSSPSVDWPYIQPGPIDGWAPNGPHAFRAWFALSSAPTANSRLVLDLADTHQNLPPKLRVTVNDRSWEHQTPAGAGAYSNPSAGREHVATFTVPADAFRVGVNRVSVTCIEGSWLIWDSLSLQAGTGATLGNAAGVSYTLIDSASAKPGLYWQGADKVHHVTVSVVHLDAPVAGELVIGPATLPVQLQRGENLFTVPVPAVGSPTTYPVELRIGGQTIPSATVELAPVRDWTVHVIHQTHLDIGYTHVQTEVLARQVEFFRRALELIEQTSDYPEEARFIWHPEGMWAVDEFMRVATPAERAAFIKACRSRRIHLDALYAQAMTGLYTEEEMMELMAGAKRFAREHGVTIDSAMQSDVPGYSWGLATALAANGVKHLSLGPNSGHRVGHTFQWGDRPFYWETPDGRDRILFWMSKNGYSMFHGGVANPTTVQDNQLLKRIDDVLAYLDELERNGYPYDMTMLRYTIGADNGPPDPTLCDAVRQWNEVHASPRFVIDSNSRFLRTFEERYGDTLPVMRGDFTPYWEDGAASTAVATATNRRACERVAQAQTLWAMRNPDLPLHKRFDEAWNKMIMYDEHTWGAYNSISDPDAAFATQQDAYKQAYAFDGASQTDQLLATIDPPAPIGSTFDVRNTDSSPRGGLVLLSAAQSSAGDQVRDAGGTPVPSQRLNSGELAFLASDIPAFGSRRYTVQAGSPPAGGSAQASGNRLSNSLLDITINPQSGAISSLRGIDTETEWVDASTGHGLNDYLYILGRNADQNRSTVSGPVTITVEDAGPLVATVRIESGAPGCSGLVRRVRLIDGQDHVELVNTAHKLKERQPEGVYFGFPFKLPGATARVDTPWAAIEVETDQLPGANRNFYCVQRFVDLNNSDRGVTWVTVDAPMLQFDPIRIAPAWGADAFRTFIDPGSFLWSWTMNNHWETNYKADQEGPITFHYALRPYTGGHDPAASQQFGRNVCQPLLAVRADPSKALQDPLLSLNGDAGVAATQLRPSRDGAAWMIRLFNTTGAPATTRLDWNRPTGATTLSNPMEEALAPAPASINLAPNQILTLRVERSATAAIPVIRYISATASSQWGGGGTVIADNLVNNSGLRAAGSVPGNETPAFYDVNAVHTPNGSAHDQWHTATGDAAPTIDFNLGGSFSLDAIHIWNGNQTNLTSRGVRQFDILVSSDGVNFTEVLSDQILNQSPNNTFIGAQVFDLRGNNAITHVRLKVDSNYGNSYTGLSEVMFTGRQEFGLSSAFERYISGKWGLVGADAAPEFDYDRDGLPNAIEYVLGSDPTKPDPALAPAASLNATEFVFEFRLDRAAAGDHPFVQYGSTLTEWTTAIDGIDGIAITTTPGGIGPGIDAVTVRIPRALATGRRLFARLCVEAAVSP